MRLIPLGLAVATALACAPAAHAAEIGNNVRCIFDALTIEEREISLILILQDMGKGMAGKQSDAIHGELDKIIGDAEVRCLARYKWLSGEAGNAKEFAVAGLMRESIGQTLRLLKQNPGDIDAWFASNKTRLGTARRLAPADREDLRSKLKAAGWTELGGRDPLGGALIYADLLQGQQRLAANFARNKYYGD